MVLWLTDFASAVHCGPSCVSWGMTCTEETRGSTGSWIHLPSQVLTLLSLFLSPFPSLPSLSHIFPLALPLSVGKAFVPKQRPIESRQEEVTTLDPELEEALSSATDTELCDLAGKGEGVGRLSS